MADMISALKALYDALGGTLSNIPDGATNADVIEAIAAQIDEGGGGSGLPAVTVEDDGDILTVVGGEWAKAAPSGGSSDIFVVHFEVYQDEDLGTLVVTTDKTAEEILAANTAGKLIVGRCIFYYAEPARATMDVSVDVLEEHFYWCYPDTDGSTNWLYKAHVYWNQSIDKWSVDEAYYELTPKVWS